MRVAIWAVAALLLSGGAARADLARYALPRGAEGPYGITVGGDGTQHISWQSVDKHLHYMRIAKGRKVDQVVDATSECGAMSSIALDSQGRPHIAYQAVRTNPTREALVYAHYDGSAWQLEEVAAGARSTAIAIDTHDRPRIAHSFTGGTQSGFEYLHLEDTGWQSEQPNGLYPWPDVPMSLALDGAGHAHVGMRVFGGVAVHATNASGSWVSEQLAGIPAVPAIALDSLGRPQAALPDVGGGTVHYLRFDGSQWQSEDLFDPNELAPMVNEPWAAWLVLDAHDRPRILFQDLIFNPQHTDQQVEVVVQAYHDGTEWRAVPLLRAGAEQWTQLAIDPTGATYGLYALRHPGLFGDSELARTARLALPDVTGEWSGSTVTAQGAGSRVDGVLHLRNDGPGHSKNAPIAFYLSADAAFDPGDFPLPIHKSTGVLAPGATRDLRISLTLPGPVNGVYLIAVVDPAARLDDLDRPNNAIAVLLTK